VTYAVDHRGHGRSGGKRVLLKDISEYTGDFDTLVGIAAKEHPGATRIVLGHSMGGGIVFAYGVEHPDDYDLMVLSGPAVAAQTAVSPLLARIAKTIGAIAPGFADAGTRLERGVPRPGRGERLRTPTRWCITARFPRALAERCCWSARRCRSERPSLTAPLLVVHGSDDRLIPIEGSRQLVAAVGSSRCRAEGLSGALSRGVQRTRAGPGPRRRCVVDQRQTVSGGAEKFYGSPSLVA